MGSSPAFAVVIPLYNKRRHVARALDSVLAQAFKDFELVVVNDGSTDGSEKIVERCGDPRVRLVNQQHAGVSAARNRGIAETGGDLIAFLDADDEWLPGYLQTVLRLRESYPQCGAYATAFRITTARGETAPALTGIPRPPYEGVIPNYFRTVYGDHAVWTSAVAVPRRTFAECGLFPVGERRREDLDMWCRIALKYPIAYSSRAGAVYHREADGRAVSGCRTALLGEPTIVRTLEHALQNNELPAGVTRDDLLEYRNSQLITRAISILQRGSPAGARRLLQKASATRMHRAALKRWMFLSSVPSPLISLALGIWRFALLARPGANPGVQHHD